MFFLQSNGEGQNETETGGFTLVFECTSVQSFLEEKKRNPRLPKM